MAFDDTKLWRSTLAEQSGDPHKKNRDLLRTAFLKMRDRAQVLAEQIARDNPPLTVHDITHLDALWEFADLIGGPDYALSPTGAFVLGGAIVVHDLAMSLACYPGSALSDEPLWKDLIHKQLERQLGRRPTQADVDVADPSLRQEINAEVMRALHAKKAEELPLQEWRANGNSYYLIDSPELRECFGQLIGRIAHSHWWDVDLLPSEFGHKIGAPSELPPDWDIDPLTIALLLRVADATHIDERRAPSFVFALRNPPDPSRRHWGFQNLMLRPTIQLEQLSYASKRDFRADEAEQWWLCFDTLQMADRELRKSDEILLKHHRQRFRGRGIASSDSPARLATTVRVNSWEPIDAKIRVTDVAVLATRLGGRQLYGRAHSIPLRELVQNACDAIRARRILQGRPSGWGTVTIRLWVENGEDYLEVADDGIGMSAEVLSGPLVDFGAPYWGTRLMMREYPGLFAKGFRSTGQFGIGFFSVFMWAKSVSVTTRRCLDGPGRTHVLEFSNGLTSRPLLRPAGLHEQRPEPGTAVKLTLAVAPDRKGGFLHEAGLGHPRGALSRLCEWLFPAIDSNLDCEYKTRRSRPVKSSDWLRLDAAKLARRTLPIAQPQNESFWKHFGKYSPAVRPIVSSDGRIVGRGVICVNAPGPREIGVVTTDGIRAASFYGILGVLEGVAADAVRNSAEPIIDERALAKWAAEQAQLVPKFLRSRQAQYEVAKIVASCGGDTGKLPVARIGNRWISIDQVSKCKFPKKVVLITDDVAKFELDGALRLDANVMIVANEYFHWGSPAMLWQSRPWPPLPERFRQFVGEEGRFAALWLVVVEAISMSWGSPFGDVMRCSSLAARDGQKPVRVGVRKNRVRKIVADVIRRP